MVERDISGELLGRLRQSRKYGGVSEDALRRAVAWAVERHPKSNAALKAARRKLHQIHGAYFSGFNRSRLNRALECVERGASEEAIRLACADVLGMHASTAERVAIAEEMYRDVFGFTGMPSSVADLACGLNPFFLPWMGLPVSTRYAASDIDGGVVTAVGRLIKALGYGGGAESRDVLASPPVDRPDVTLLLKTAPCLERQEPGSVVRLLRQIRSPYMVVSFPTKSLGGREKGMTRSYGKFMEEVASNLSVDVEELAYPTEAVYVLKRLDLPEEAVSN